MLFDRHRLGGETCLDEIQLKEVPRALAIMDQIHSQHKEVIELFFRYDKDRTGLLPSDQLQPLLTEINGGIQCRLPVIWTE